MNFNEDDDFLLMTMMDDAQRRAKLDSVREVVKILNYGFGGNYGRKWVAAIERALAQEGFSTNDLTDEEFSYVIGDREDI